MKRLIGRDIDSTTLRGFGARASYQCGIALDGTRTAKGIRELLLHLLPQHREIAYNKKPVTRKSCEEKLWRDLSCVKLRHCNRVEINFLPPIKINTISTHTDHVSSCHPFIILCSSQIWVFTLLRILVDCSQLPLLFYEGRFLISTYTSHFASLDPASQRIRR